MVLLQIPFFIWSCATGPSAVRVLVGMAQTQPGSETLLPALLPRELHHWCVWGLLRCKSLPRSQRALFATQPGLPTRSDTSPNLVRWQSHLAELGLTWFLFHKLNSPAPDRETMAFSMAWALAAFVALFEEYTSLDLVNAAIHGVCSAGMCSHDTPRLL